MHPNSGEVAEIEAAPIASDAYRYSPVVVLALLIGLLPLVNGLLFRAYTFPRHPEVLNVMFDFEFLYLFAELGIIFWAKAQGMSFKNAFLRLGKTTRYALLAFLASFWISSLAFAPTPTYSMIRAFYWPVHIGCAFAVSYLMVTVDDKAVARSVEIFTAGFFAIALVLGVHYYFAPFPHHVFVKWFDWTSIAPGYLSVRQFGMVSGFVLTAWIAAMLSGKKMGVSALGSFFIAALLFGIMFWSGTRSAMLAVAVAAPVVFLFGRKAPTKTAMLSVIAATLVGAALSTIWIPPGGSYGILTTSKFTVDGSVDVSSGRIEMWMHAMNMVRQSPLLGWGEGSFYPLLAMAGKGFHLQPHNFVIQFLLSWGILAGGIALVMMAKALLRLHLGLHSAQRMIVPLAVVDAILVMAMLDGALFTLRTILPAIFFWILAEKISADAGTASA